MGEIGSWGPGYELRAGFDGSTVNVNMPWFLGSIMDFTPAPTGLFLEG